MKLEKLSSHLWDASLPRWRCPLLYRSISVSWGPIHLISGLLTPHPGSSMPVSWYISFPFSFVASGHWVSGMGLPLSFFLYLEFLFVPGERSGSSFIFFPVCWNPVLPAPFVVDVDFSLMRIFEVFVKDQLAVRSYIWVFWSIPLIYPPVFAPAPCCSCYYDSGV